MQRRTIAMSAVILGLALPGDEAAAQTARDLAGSWKLVSLTVEQGGKRVELFGPDPRGQLMLGSDGRFALVLLRRELPAFASNARLTGTPEENRAVVQGSLAFFGAYTVDEANKALALHIEGSTFPNWDRTEQRRSFTLSGDLLTLDNPASSAGAGANQVVWRRAR